MLINLRIPQVFRIKLISRSSLRLFCVDIAWTDQIAIGATKVVHLNPGHFSTLPNILPKSKLLFQILAYRMTTFDEPIAPHDCPTKGNIDR